MLGRLVPQRYRHSLAHRVTMLTTQLGTGTRPVRDLSGTAWRRVRAIG